MADTIRPLKIEDYIKTFDKIVPDDLCDQILGEFSETDLWETATTMGSDISLSPRQCDIIGLSKPEVINANHEYRKQLDRDLFNSVHLAMKKYQEELSPRHLSIVQDSGYELLRYRENQYYKQHTDHFIHSPRTLSCTISLNENYQGGEFAFFDRQLKLKLQKGSVLIFPSNFMYPHEVLPVLKGTRYSIITWMI